MRTTPVIDPADLPDELDRRLDTLLDRATSVIWPETVGMTGEAYDRWLHDEVAAALADPRPSIPHDEVMAELRARRAQRRNADG